MNARVPQSASAPQDDGSAADADCSLPEAELAAQDEIYALTKAIYEHLDDIKEINSKANYMSLEDALSGIPSDLHPGAMKYYVEQGLTIPDYLK